MSNDIEHRACFDLPVPGGIIDIHYGVSEAFTKEFVKGVKKILAPITSKDIDDHCDDSIKIDRVFIERGRACGKTFELNTMKKHFPKHIPPFHF